MTHDKEKQLYIATLVLCLERLRKDIDDGKLKDVDEEQFYGINFHSSKLCEFLLYATNSSRSIDLTKIGKEQTQEN